jgi:hypothetical protein
MTVPTVSLKKYGPKVAKDKANLARLFNIKEKLMRV